MRRVTHLKTQNACVVQLAKLGRVSLKQETTSQGVVAYAVSYPQKVGAEESTSNVNSVHLSFDEALREFVTFNRYFNCFCAHEWTITSPVDSLEVCRHCGLCVMNYVADAIRRI